MRTRSRQALNGQRTCKLALHAALLLLDEGKERSRELGVLEVVVCVWCVCVCVGVCVCVCVCRCVCVWI